MKRACPGRDLIKKRSLSQPTLLKSSVGINHRPVKFKGNGISVTVSSNLLEKACFRKPLMVSRATQTDMSLPSPVVPSVQRRQVETAENRLKRYGLVRKQLAVLLHATLCHIRDGLLGHSAEIANSVSMTMMMMMTF